MIPIGAVLSEVPFVIKGFSGLDAGERNAGNTVHLEWDEQSVPVNRRILHQHVRDVDADIVAFPEPDKRARDGAVDARRHAGFPINPYGERRDRKIKILA